MEWQPIETAPRDGTNILVWWPSEMHCPVTAHYSTGKWTNEPGFAWKFTGWGQEKKTEPTHWMPLPEPPKDT